MRFPQPDELFEDKYRVERELGAGGFSNVYLVRDEFASRHAALKVLLPNDEHGYNAETRARFDREVAMLAKLDHPHLVTLFDCGESNTGLLYMVFEFVPGEDLTHLLERRGRLDPDTVKAILTQVLSALQQAHQAGLVHRDIKPENIRVCSPPGEPIEVCLLDFGIARATDSGAPSITKTGELIGTPRYMSPEQLLERPLTPASDIYSLGMVAFELLVGRDALPGNRFSDQFDRLMTGHVFSTELIDAIGPELWSVVERMTAQNPDQRLPTAPAVLGALAHGLDRTAARPPRPRPVAPANQPEPKPLPTALVVAALTVLALGAAFFAIRPAPEPPVRVNPPTSPAGLLRTPDLGNVHQSAAAGPPAETVWDAGLVADTGLPDEPGLPAVAGGCAIRQPAKPPGVNMLLPDDFDNSRPTPMIIWIYSHNQQDPTVTVRQEAFRRLIDEENVIIAVPEAPNPTMVSSWNPSDLIHVEEVKDALVEQYCVDLDQLYVWSSAGGGVLTTRLACLPWPSGVAIGNFVETQTAKFDCPSPRPLLWIAARDSRHQPINGGGDCLFQNRRRFGESVRVANERRGCGPDSKVTLNEKHTKCERFSGCDVPFEVCRTDGGLGWPGTPQPKAAEQNSELCPEPPPEPDFDAARHAWDFFESIRQDP